AETEGLVGFFLNTLALRGDLSGDPTFRELLARARETALGAYAHQELPFEKLVDELHPQRNLSHSPIFQVALVLQNAERGGLELGGVQAQAVGGGGATAKFDLLLGLSERDGRLRCALEYNTDLFNGERMERLLGQFQ